MPRKSTGKRIRFEIFKRDGFKCVYCGSSPVQSVLRIDHVLPVAEGGTNAPENLVTSCHDCNSGKSSVKLNDKKLSKPDINGAHKEHVEQLKQFLLIQKEIADARREYAEEIADYWINTVGPMTEDMFNRLAILVKEWPHEKLIEAIDITARKMGGQSSTFSSWKANNQAKYFHGIIRKWRSDNANG